MFYMSVYTSVCILLFTLNLSLSAAIAGRDKSAFSLLVCGSVLGRLVPKDQATLVLRSPHAEMDNLIFVQSIK
jgi:hypothetical protein